MQFQLNCNVSIWILTFLTTCSQSIIKRGNDGNEHRVDRWPVPFGSLAFLNNDLLDYEEPGYEREYERNLRFREQQQVNVLRQIMNEDYSTVAIPSSEYVPSNSRIGISRRASIGFDSQKSPVHLQALLVMASMALVITVIFGGVVIYRSKRYFGKHSENDTIFGGLRLDNPSPTGSLLSDPVLEGDRKLAHSAQMYHYQHQKQQMLAVEKANNDLRNDETSGTDDDVGDFTVYECPGLTETSQLEVENPLFTGDLDDHGPSTNGSYGEIIHESELDEANSDSTPTTKTVIQP